jgi:hypothetical protein
VHEQDSIVVILILTEEHLQQVSAEQVGWSGNASDLYPRGGQFESRPGHWLPSLFFGFPQFVWVNTGMVG